MDDVIARSRYPRQSVRSKRKRKVQGDKVTIPEIIMRQAAVAALILVILVSVKSFNSPATNFVVDRVHELVSHDIDLNSIFEEIDGVFGENATKEDKLSQDNFGDESVSEIGGVVLPAESIGENSVDIRIISPVEGNVSSAFGERVHYIKGTLEMHNGIDIEAAPGSSVKAAMDGTVLEAGSDPYYGSNYLKVEHSDGIVTVYAQCSGLIAKKGQEVKQGEIIAEVGNTGAAVGTHLHFEVWKNGVALDPLNLIDVSLN